MPFERREGRIVAAQDVEVAEQDQVLAGALAALGQEPGDVVDLSVTPVGAKESVADRARDTVPRDADIDSGRRR